MGQYNIAAPKVHLSELARRAIAGEEIIIARDNRPLVRRVPVRLSTRTRQPGSGRGQLLWMAPDFDGIPEGFAEDI